METLVEIYCDGSSEGNSTGKGGWGTVICVNGKKVWEASGYMSQATNNTAEITAAISGLRKATTYDFGRTDREHQANAKEVNGGCRTRYVLISDSQLVLRYATGEYTCRKWHLVPLSIELKKLYRQLGAETKWVKGHNGNQFNEECDQLAKSAKTRGIGLDRHIEDQASESSDVVLGQAAD